MKLNILTNSRPTSDLGANLVVGCTYGQIKVTPDMAKLVGAVDGDNIAIGQDAEENTFIFKGSEESGARGNKLAKSGSYLTMSSANSWDILGGDTNVNKYFKVEGEPVEEEGVVYVQITFDKEEEKTERKSSDDKGQDVDVDAQDGAFQEEE